MLHHISLNHRMSWFGRDLKDNFFPTSLLWVGMSLLSAVWLLLSREAVCKANSATKNSPKVAQYFPVLNYIFYYIHFARLR